MGKIKHWMQEHHMGWIVVALAALAGAFVGRRSSSGIKSDLGRLQADYARLTARLEERERELDELRKLSASDEDRLRSLAAELARARSALDDLGESIRDGQDRSGKLAENNRRLEEWIQKYGEGLSRIKD